MKKLMEWNGCQIIEIEGMLSSFEITEEEVSKSPSNPTAVRLSDMSIQEDGSAEPYRFQTPFIFFDAPADMLEKGNKVKWTLIRFASQDAVSTPGFVLSGWIQDAEGQRQNIEYTEKVLATLRSPFSTWSLKQSAQAPMLIWIFVGLSLLLALVGLWLAFKGMGNIAHFAPLLSCISIVFSQSFFAGPSWYMRSALKRWQKRAAA